MLRARQETPKRLRLNPARSQGITAPQDLPEESMTTDHKLTATAAASGQANGAMQVTRPPRGQPGTSGRQRQGSNASQAKCTTHKRPKKVSATTPLDTNDYLRQTARKRRRNPGTCQDDLWTRWRRLNNGGRGHT